MWIGMRWGVSGERCIPRCCVCMVCSGHFGTEIVGSGGSDGEERIDFEVCTGISYTYMYMVYPRSKLFPNRQEVRPCRGVI